MEIRKREKGGPIRPGPWNDKTNDLGRVIIKCRGVGNGRAPDECRIGGTLDGIRIDKRK